ncbi:MAG: GDSL-type esterase/lipase family protein [Patescibacteria group bacterium]
MDKHILIFGTSTTYGAWDSQGGWVARLRKYIDKNQIESNFKNEILIYNQGISGAKTEDILKTLEPEAQARLGHNRDNEIIIILHVGINDTIYNEDLGKVEVSPDEFKNNLKLLLDKAKQYSEKIIIVGSMPVDKRVDPMPWAPGRSYRNEYVGKYNEILENVSKEEKAYFVEVFKKFIDTDYSSFLTDGVHMNDEGHKKLYEMVRDFLLEKKII